MRNNRNTFVGSTLGDPVLECLVCKESVLIQGPRPRIQGPRPSMARFLRLCLFWMKLHDHRSGGKK